MEQGIRIRTISLLCFIMAMWMPQILSAQSCLPEGITFTTQSQIDSFPINYPNCTEIEGDVIIGGLDITNLNGLSVLTSIGGDISIYGNWLLVNLKGLEGLTTINNDLYIESNNALVSLEGLHNVTSIQGSLYVPYHSCVGNNSLKSLLGLNNVAYISGDFYIGGNPSLLGLTNLESLTSVGGLLSIGSVCGGNERLKSLQGLKSITSIGGNLEVYLNDSLTSLSGLDNIEESSIIHLAISYNFLLSTCAVQSICDYLASPNGIIDIHDNASGCNSIMEIEEACESIGIPEQQSEPTLSIYPNPFTTSTTIEYELTEPSNVQLMIYNAIGEVVYSAEDRLMPVGKHSFTWSPERLPEGLYYAVLRCEEGVEVVKMVKQ